MTIRVLFSKPNERSHFKKVSVFIQLFSRPHLKAALWICKQPRFEIGVTCDTDDIEKETQALAAKEISIGKGDQTLWAKLPG